MILNKQKIPTNPGIYFFLDKEGKIIYIGKAKNLKNRVSSYWQKTTELTPQKQQMLKEIKKVQYTIVDNETESILLEASQIKKHQPKYNIVLKDDKNWAYIVILNEPFPRITLAYGRQRKSGEYFGPYTSKLSARLILKLLHRILPLRTCRRDLSKLPKGKVCLEYNINRCLGPCEQKIAHQEYNELIRQAKLILKGDTKIIAQKLEQQIRLASQKKNYELAVIKKDQLFALKKLQQKQKIVGNIKNNNDIINFHKISDYVGITVMQIRQGILGDKFNFKVRNTLAVPEQEILENFINQFYSKRVDLPQKIILPISIDQQNIYLPKKIKILEAKQGKNKQLLDMVAKNAKDWLEKNLSDRDIKKLIDLKKILKLKNTPYRIEAYDISNIQGQYAYGSMVVFEYGQIAADQYRIFKIKNVKGANDFAMLAEVLSRRKKHTEWTTPDLIIIDGGKGQLSSVYKVIPKSWQEKIVSLAKKEEEIFLPSQKKSLKLDKKSPTSLFIQNIRNQAHKFAIKHYRKLHRKSV